MRKDIRTRLLSGALPQERRTQSDWRSRENGLHAQVVFWFVEVKREELPSLYRSFSGIYICVTYIAGSSTICPVI